MPTQEQNEEIAALRQLVNDDALRDEEAVTRLKDARSKLKEKTDSLEAGGFINAGEFDSVRDLFDEAITFLTPVSGATRPAELSPEVQKRVAATIPNADPNHSPQTGIITDKNVIEAGGTDGIDTFGQQSASK
jgi:hypothetical protein